MAAVTRKLLVTAKNGSVVFNNLSDIIFGAQKQGWKAKILGIEAEQFDPMFTHEGNFGPVQIPVISFQVQQAALKYPSQALSPLSPKVVAVANAGPSIMFGNVASDDCKAYLGKASWFSYASRAPVVSGASPVQLQTTYQQMFGSYSNEMGNKWVVAITFSVSEMTDLEMAQLAFGAQQ